jgi:hypothetical protein
MIFQDASQSFTYWCYGKLPEPVRIITAGRDYWLCWRYAPAHA